MDDFRYDPYLKLYLPLGELDGASFMSRDAYGHLCTVTGATYVAQGWYFDGVDDVITIPDSASLDLTTTGTIEAWIKPAVVNAYLTALSKGRIDVQDNCYALFVTNTGVPEIYFDKVATAAIMVAGDAMAANQWYHIVGTWDGTTISFYQNGAFKNSALQTYNQAGTDNVLTIGNSENLTYDFNGVIGEVRIYNRALTLGEIQHIYNTTKWKYSG